MINYKHIILALGVSFGLWGCSDWDDHYGHQQKKCYCITCYHNSLFLYVNFYRFEAKNFRSISAGMPRRQA